MNFVRGMVTSTTRPLPSPRGLGGRISSLRAFRRARDGAAKGRGSWERIRWPDAKFEVTSAKCDLRNEQQREKREESREKREERSEKRETSTIKIRGSKDAMVRSQNGGMAQKRVGP